MANFITGIRIICAAALVFCPTFSIRFYILYIVGSISDVLDGMTARHFGKVTELGARLDTVADIIFVLIVLIKILLKVHIPLWLIIWTVCIALIKFLNLFIGLITYKRFLAEHTALNKICGVLLFLFPFLINILSMQTVLIPIIVICAVATFAAFQEGYYILNGKEIQ